MWTWFNKEIGFWLSQEFIKSHWLLRIIKPDQVQLNQNINQEDLTKLLFSLINNIHELQMKLLQELCIFSYIATRMSSIEWARNWLFFNFLRLSQLDSLLFLVSVSTQIEWSLWLLVYSNLLIFLFVIKILLVLLLGMFLSFCMTTNTTNKTILL